MYLPYGLGSASDPADYELPLTAYRNGTVYPADDYQIPRGQPMGVLDQDARPVRISGLERYRNILLGEPAANGEPVAFIDEEVIFAGYISHHYGHFLLETLSRLWAYKESELRIVWAAGRNLTEWSHKLLRFLSVTHKRHLVLRQPTRFAKIWVPAPGYIIPDHFHYRQKDALATVQGRLGEDKIYLTRQSFTGGFYHIDGEAELTARLRDKGWKIVTPEGLPIAEQVGFFANARVIAGVEGSALHTCVLCKDMKARMLTLRRPKPNRNYDTIARTMGITHQGLPAHIVDDPANPKRAMIVDPVATAALLEERAER